MSNSNLDLVKKISHISRNAYITDVLRVIEQAINDTRTNKDELKKSIVLLADVETIRLWELFLDLKFEESWTLEDRIARIVFRINARGLFTKEFIIEQSDIFQNGEIQINEDSGGFLFEIEFVSTIGNPPNLQAFSEMLNINKPAHVVYRYKFRYRTHGELRPFRHNTLSNYTNAQLRATGAII